MVETVTVAKRTAARKIKACVDGRKAKVAMSVVEVSKLRREHVDVLEEIRILRNSIRDRDARDRILGRDAADNWDVLFGMDSLDSRGTMFGLRHNPLLQPVRVKGGKWSTISDSEWRAEMSRITETTAFAPTTATSYIRRDIDDGARINARAASTWWTWYDPVARNVINALQYYTIGQGAKINVMVPEIEAVLITFWKNRLNRMEMRQKVGFRKWLIDGELVPLLIKEKGAPYARLRYLNPDEITDIHRDPNDAELMLVLKRDYFLPNFNMETKYYPTIDAPDGFDMAAGLMPRMAANATLVDGTIAGFYPLDSDNDHLGRGLPIHFPVMPWYRERRDFVKARMARNIWAARIFMARKRGGATATGAGKSVV